MITTGFVDDDDVTLLGVFYQPAGALALPSPTLTLPSPNGRGVFDAAAAPLANYELRIEKNEAHALSQPNSPTGGGSYRARIEEAAWIDGALTDDQNLIDLLAESIAAEAAVRSSTLYDPRLVIRHRPGVEPAGPAHGRGQHFTL